jgi:hypothetical protein
MRIYVDYPRGTAGGLWCAQLIRRHRLNSDWHGDDRHLKWVGDCNRFVREFAGGATFQAYSFASPQVDLISAEFIE